MGMLPPPHPFLAGSPRTHGLALSFLISASSLTRNCLPPRFPIRSLFCAMCPNTHMQFITVNQPETQVHAPPSSPLLLVPRTVHGCNECEAPRLLGDWASEDIAALHFVCGTCRNPSYPAAALLPLTAGAVASEVTCNGKESAEADRNGRAPRASRRLLQALDCRYLLRCSDGTRVFARRISRVA